MASMLHVHSDLERGGSGMTPGVRDLLIRSYSIGWLQDSAKNGLWSITKTVLYDAGKDMSSFGPAEIKQQMIFECYII